MKNSISFIIIAILASFNLCFAQQMGNTKNFKIINQSNSNLSIAYNNVAATDSVTCILLAANDSIEVPSPSSHILRDFTFIRIGFYQEGTKKYIYTDVVPIGRWEIDPKYLEENGMGVKK